MLNILKVVNPMKLYEIAHSRTGDKGNLSTISVIAYDPKDYDLIKREITAQRVKSHMSPMVNGTVTRYELDGIFALNFVLEEALSGGVTNSLALDMHGKTLGAHLLEIDISEGQGTF